MLVGVIHGPTLEEAEAQIERSLPFAQGFEFRLDAFSDDLLDKLPILRKKVHRPLIFTFRKNSQGGARNISEEERIEKLSGYLELAPTYCDLETDTPLHLLEQISSQFPGVRFLGSYHNFQDTPDDLDALWKAMQNRVFSAYKIAVKAKNTVDLLRLMAFAQTKDNLAWISMGPYGQPSRILGPVTGSLFSYAGLEDSSLFQLDLETLWQVYRFPSLNRQTKVYALIGDPVESSIGHLYHNKVFGEKKKNAVYVKLRVKAEELKPFFHSVEMLPFHGFSVTMPLKMDVMPFLQRIDETAKQIRAVNTIQIVEKERWGFNTDAEGALDPVEKRHPVKGKRIAILGAGGAAKAIAFEAIRRGANVIIANRTFENARELAESLHCQAMTLEEFGKNHFDCIVFAIPYAKDGSVPIDLDHISWPPIVMDIAVQDKEPLFLKKAKENGAHCIDWKEMFYGQAALQQKLWEN